MNLHRRSPVKEDCKHVNDQRRQQPKTQGQMEVEPDLQQALQLNVFLQLAYEHRLFPCHIEQLLQPRIETCLVSGSVFLRQPLDENVLAFI